MSDLNNGAGLNDGAGLNNDSDDSRYRERHMVWLVDNNDNKELGVAFALRPGKDGDPTTWRSMTRPDDLKDGSRWWEYQHLTTTDTQAAALAALKQHRNINNDKSGEQ